MSMSPQDMIKSQWINAVWEDGVLQCITLIKGFIYFAAALGHQGISSLP